MHQDWRTLKNSEGRVLLWIFPPFQLVAQTIRKLKECRVSATLLLPAWLCYWTPMLAELLIIASRMLDYHKGMYILGSRLPAAMPGKGCPYSLMAYRVCYD